MILRPFSQCRTYVSEVRRPSRLGKTVGLDHFLQRTKAIALWREIVRRCYKIQDKRQREEALQHPRAEFKRNKEVKDITQIRYLISTGTTEWGHMERYMDGL